MVEIMAQMLTNKEARSKQAAEEVAVKHASDPLVFWSSLS